MPRKDSDNQHREARISGYSPEWSKRSRDDVPQSDKPPRPNSVVESIMTKGRSGKQQQGSPGQTPSKSDR